MIDRMRIVSLKPGHARPQTAEAADDEIDRHAGPRRLAQRGDHRRILELIHLGDDARRTPRALVLDLARDQIEEALPHASSARRAAV